MTLLEKLRRANPGFILFGRDDPAFRPYGVAVSGDWSGFVETMEKTVAVPAEGIVYVAAHPPLEALPEARELAARSLGGMPFQIGYCAGRNSRLNGLEYHGCSEIVVAADDLVLLLGLRADLDPGEVPPGFDANRAVGLLVLRGQAVELFSGTLHLAPCLAREGSFRAAIILARGTNEDFAPGERTEGDPLLRKRNKWIITHPERRVLVDQGVLPLVRGPNRELVPVGEGA